MVLYCLAMARYAIDYVLLFKFAAVASPLKKVGTFNAFENEIIA